MQLVELSPTEMESLAGGKKNVVLVNINLDLSRSLELGSLVIVRNNFNTTVPIN